VIGPSGGDSHSGVTSFGPCESRRGWPMGLKVLRKSGLGKGSTIGASGGFVLDGHANGATRESRANYRGLGKDVGGNRGAGT